MITKIETYTAEIPLTISFPTSYGEHMPTGHVFVEITDSTGAVGYGEGTSLALFTGETPVSMKTLIDQQFVDLLIGVEVQEALSLLRAMVERVQENPGARAGVEIALLDLYCKLRKIPFYELFGFKVRNEVDTIYPVGAIEPTQAAESAAEGVKKGFKYFKLKAHGQVEEDLERIMRVLEIMTPDCKVRVDANCGWKNYETASKVLTRLDKEELIEYVEQPVARENLSDLKKLSQEFNTPIFADESCHTPKDAMNLLVNEIVDGLCLKMAKAGGPTQIKLMADMAREFKTDVTMISALGTSLDERVWVNLAVVTPNLHSALEIGSWILTTQPVTPILKQSPKVSVSEDIGLGVTLNKSQLS